MRNRPFIVVFIIMAMVFSVSCTDTDYTPKPRGYFRIAMPEKKYKIFDTLFPYSFEYPAYATIQPDFNINAEPYWINIEFPAFKGTLHISYKHVYNDSILNQYFEDARSFANKHIAKADDIEPKAIIDDKHQVYGLIYEIKGTGVASTYQFYVTDSTTNFLRGALYFNILPNNDSLAPVIDYVKADIDHLIQTLHWKKKS